MQAIVSGCPYDCGGSCPLTFYVDGGEIKRIGPYEEPDSLERPRLRPCARGLAQAQRIHHPDRLLYPMKRVGERGAGDFQRVSWDEALDTVAAEMRRIMETYGIDAILHLRGAGNTDGLLHGTLSSPNRFFEAVGKVTVGRGVISFEGARFAAQHTLGLNPPQPGPASLLQSKLIVMWGFNPSEAIFGTNTNYYLALAKERGTRFVFVDPRFADSAAALADQWIPILPGTDAAMLVAIAYVLIDENLCDQGFLDRCTYGFDRFRDYCLGVEDGIPKTPAWAEAICRVQAGVIAGLAREYAASRPADLRAGWAAGRTAFGEQFHRACIALAAMTGNVGIPGGSPGCFLSQDFQATLGVRRPLPPASPDSQSVHYWHWADAVVKGKAGGYPSDIKMIYSIGGNRLNQCADVNKGIEALKKAEFVVVQEQVMIPLARFADILLPACTHVEREDIQVPHARGDYLFYNNKAIEPIGESMSDLDIFTALARRLGLAGFEERTEREWLAASMANAQIDAESLRRQNIWRLASDRDQVPLADFVADPAAHPLPTPSGKIELYSQTLARRNHPLLPAVPKYLDAWESLSHPLAGRYPLVLITPHSRQRVNSTLDEVAWLQELEPHTAWLNPVDAAARGIEDGARVLVRSDVGVMEITARVTERIMPGVVSVYQGTWSRPDENGVDQGGCVNTLCKDTLSPAEAAAINGVLVEVAVLSRS